MKGSYGDFFSLQNPPKKLIEKKSRDITSGNLPFLAVFVPQKTAKYQVVAIFVANAFYDFGLELYIYPISLTMRHFTYHLSLNPRRID